MSKGHWFLIIALAFLLTFAYCSKPATAGEMFPLIWQAWSAPNSSRDVVKRLHDPEAGINCYVLTSKFDEDGYSNGRHNVTTSTSSISCVKVK